MKNIIIKFFKNDEGATAIEYGLIAALISVGILGALTATGTETENIYSFIEENIVPALSGANADD